MITAKYALSRSEAYTGWHLKYNITDQNQTWQQGNVPKNPHEILGFDRLPCAGPYDGSATFLSVLVLPTRSTHMLLPIWHNSVTF